MMKKVFSAVVAAAILSIGLLAGCAGTGQNASSSSAQQPAGEKVKVVCATFPAYDWARAVVGDEADRFEIDYLMGSGVDLHSYQPSVQDIAKISDADLFVYVGGESDGWAEDAVKNAKPGLHALSMLDAVGDAVVEEEVVEGMQADEHEHGDAEGAEEGHDHEADEHGHGDAEEADAHEAHEHGDAEEPEHDEHVWLSLKNAKTVVDAMAGELAKIDAEHADAYAANAKAYDAKLVELDGKFDKAVKSGAKDTVVFADRFPFRYLVDDYGLNYYAAFVGCSAETEASFETVAFLAKKVDELGLSSVFTIENSDQEIAKTVIENTEGKNQQILVMDSLQSVKDSDVEAGKTYLSAMEENLDVLTKGLA